MTLSDWRSNGWIVEHTATRPEIVDLIGVADRELADSRVRELSVDGRFRSAYNAVLQIAAAALAAEGYRAAREAHHYRTLQSLALTMRIEEALVDQMDSFRKKRNIADYERAGAISDTEVSEMIDLAHHLRKSFDAWLTEKHPELA